MLFFSYRQIVAMEFHTCEETVGLARRLGHSTDVMFDNGSCCAADAIDLHDMVLVGSTRKIKKYSFRSLRII